MPSYKLIYFPIRGRAEHLRLMFVYAKVPFEDVRITKDEWEKLKPTTPWGQVPVLEIDGVMVEQSLPLARHLAKQFGLDGKDDMERLQADVFVAHLDDLKNQFGTMLREQDPEKKTAILKNLQKDVFPVFFEKLEKRVAKNGFSVSKSILWSDILLSALLDALMIKNILGDDFATKYPNLMRVKDTVFGTPEVKAYLAKRPHTDI